MKKKLTNVRLAFTNQLFVPGKVGDDSKNRYSCVGILAPDDPQIRDIKLAMQEVAAAKWPANWKPLYKAMQTQDRLCLHDGDNKPEYDGFPGNFYVSAGSKESVRPAVRHRDGKTQLTESDGVIYAGCYADMIVDIWAMDDKKHGKRVNAQLMGVQFRGDGDAFGGGAPASDEDFDALGDVDASDIQLDEDELDGLI